ncbi:hypothetical protein CCP3SC15_4670001 [Gammaproteobacteria bacterium]
MAHLSATPYTATPADAESWLARIDRAGNHLVVLEDLIDPSLSESIEPIASSAAQTKVLRRLEQTWFAPLQNALRAGTLASLTLYPYPGLPRRITGSLLRRRWWRRSR